MLHRWPSLTTLLLTLLFLIACAASPKTSEGDETSSPLTQRGSCSLLAPGEKRDETAIEALLAAEARLVTSQEIEPLMQLWASDGQVRDVQHTPTDPADDQSWRGLDAIRYRYTGLVFPSAPTVAPPENLRIMLSDGQAEVTATTAIGEEVSESGDHWKLAKIGQCWLIESLEYNWEPAESK